MNTETQPKLCRDCTHLAKSSVGDAQSWKCMAPQNILSRSVDLVTGAPITIRRNLNCYFARMEHADGAEFSCGQTGRWFEPAPPKFEDPKPKPVDHKSNAADLLKQLDFMK